MFEYIKDVFALVVGTVLVVLISLAIGGGTFRLSLDMVLASRSVGSRPVSASETMTVGLEPVRGVH